MLSDGRLTPHKSDHVEFTRPERRLLRALATRVVNKHTSPLLTFEVYEPI